MTNLLNSLNDWTEVLLGVGIFNCWQQASQTKAAAEKAEELARNKQLREAAQIVEISVAVWSSQPGFWERLIRRWLLGNLLKQLKWQLEQWRKQILEADKLAAKAKALLKQDPGDPLESQILSQAIALYQSCTAIAPDEKVLRAIKQCQQELQQRQRFQKLVKEAETQAKNQFFKLGLAAYRQAEQLYATAVVQAAIANCEAQIQYEETYSNALSRAQQASQEGRLRGAITLLESVLSNFPRSDGKELLERLQCTVKGKEKFRQGLNAEKLGAFRGAASIYEEAKALLSDPTECQIRLGLVAIKTEDWTTALSHLENVRGEQAAYLRGFAHTKQGNLQQAHREWQFLPHPLVGYQRDALKSLAQRQHLLALQNIEQLVANERLETAKTASEEFINRFGFEPTVQGNLDDYIHPQIETAIWQNSDWGTIADTMQQVWVKQPHPQSLHNWTVAVYYYALTEPQETRSFVSVENLIIALSTALANLRQDPALQKLPWLGNTPINYDSVFSDLQQRIEEVIDSHKNKDINEYLKLRDRYRLEMVALRLMNYPLNQGLRIKGLFITPGCYELHKESLNKIDFPAQLWGTLYSSWGLAVAACQEGDIQRAIKLKPLTKPIGEVESFAQKFMAYHEGYYLLQQQKWQEAMAPLNLAKVEIRATSEWQIELDRLYGLQRQTISNFKEHLELAQFWYDLLGSQPSKSYLAQYRAEQIREQLAQEQISVNQAAQKLEVVKQIDEKNPVVLDLIEKVQVSQEIKEILSLLERDRFSDAVRQAKYSKHEKVRFIVAEMCIDILIKGAETRKLPHEIISQLGRWAYELCPNEPAFQEIYRLMRIPY